MPLPPTDDEKRFVDVANGVEEEEEEEDEEDDAKRSSTEGGSVPLEDGKGKMRSGRKKIKIEFIQDKSRRHITFSKRKAGIMKKI
ncbi:hypothetical protein HDU67_000367 [Dinochytrium kinnereticum]|nr:hypothetical protein HDU67_000367 [Dinochytrium kinnereticum]